MKLEGIKKFKNLKLFEQGQFPESGITVIKVPGGWLFTTIIAIGLPSVGLVGSKPQQQNFVSTVFVPRGVESHKDVEEQIQELEQKAAETVVEEIKGNIITGNFNEEENK